jgi:hypothetical protein
VRRFVAIAVPVIGVAVWLWETLFAFTSMPASVFQSFVEAIIALGVVWLVAMVCIAVVEKVAKAKPKA